MTDKTMEEAVRRGEPPAMAEKRNVVTLSQMMMPSQANVAGNVHGGEIMKMMDTAAGAVARKYSRSNCVTARVDELQFHLPIFVGAFVSCTATLVYTGRSSMEVYVEVAYEELESEQGPQHALSAYFTMVALGKNGRPRAVQPFVPETDREKELHCLAESRVETYKNRPKTPEKCNVIRHMLQK